MGTKFSPFIQDMLDHFAFQLAGVQPLPESKDDEACQLIDARVIANWLGLYDAADDIKGMNLDEVRDQEKRLNFDVCLNFLPRLNQSQDSTSAQALRLAIACDLMGLKKAAEAMRDRHEKRLVHSA